MSEDIPDDTELSDPEVRDLQLHGWEGSAREPTHCPDCGSERILTQYDSHADPGYRQWFEVGCHDCGNRNRVTPR